MKMARRICEDAEAADVIPVRLDRRPVSTSKARLRRREVVDHEGTGSFPNRLHGSGGDVHLSPGLKGFM
jgi:hypothetical protein